MKSSSATHRQIFVKVNAQIDEGIAELVSALSEIEGLETLESCQGELNGARAYVLFRYRDWQECGRFMFDRLLPKIPPGLRAEVSLSLDNISARIILDAGAIHAVADCVRRVIPISC